MADVREYKNEENMSNRDLSFSFPDSLKDLIKFEQLAEEMTKVNFLTGPYYMQELLKGMEIASKLYAGALYRYEMSIAKSKAVRAVMMLDEASSVLVAKSLRVNEENMKAFAESSSAYLEAKEEESYYSAISMHLKQKVEKFQRAHDDARKIFESNRNLYGSSAAASSNAEVARD